MLDSFYRCIIIDDKAIREMNRKVNQPLSEKPVGYFLAVLGGTLGAPLGWITSTHSSFDTQ